MKKLIAPFGALALLLSVGVPTLAQTTTANAVKSVVVTQDKMSPTKKPMMKKKMPMKKKMTGKSKMAKKGKMAAKKPAPKMSK